MSKRKRNWTMHYGSWQDTGRPDAITFKTVDEDGQCECSFSITIEELDELLTSFLSMECDLNFAGKLTMRAELIGSKPNPSKALALLDLVANLLTHQSLHGETDLTARLNRLRDHFVQSLKLIDSTIASIPAHGG